MAKAADCGDGKGLLERPTLCSTQHNKGKGMIDSNERVKESNAYGRDQQDFQRGVHKALTSSD